MPGDVAQATAVDVMPYALAAAYTEMLEWPVQVDGPYSDGRTNRQAQATDAGKRSWRLARPLTDTELALHVEHFEERRGPLEPFYFYSEESQHDPTGVLTPGRYLVRYASSISFAWAAPRTKTEFQLEEIR